MPDENELQDPAPIRDQINKKIGELFDLNQRVVSVLKAQAHDFEAIAGFFDVQKNRAFEIAGLIIELAAIASSNTTNIIVAEFGHSDHIGMMDLSEDEPHNHDEGDTDDPESS